MALSNKQQAFINAYLSCWNATEAALRAGYARRSAHTIGWETLRKPEVAEAIKQRLQETTMTSDEVLMRLAEQARGVPAAYMTEDGYVDIERMVRDGKTHLIKKIKTTLYGRDYEFYDAQAALKLIGDHFGLFKGNQSDATTNDDTLWDEAAEDGQAAAVPPSTA